MKKLFTVLCIAAFAGSMPTGFAAEPEKKEEKQEIGKEVKMNPLVATIDYAAHKFTFKRPSGEIVTFTATDKSEFKNGDAPAKFEDIKVGDYVTGIRLVKSETEMEIVKVTKFGPNEGPKKPKAKAAGKSEEKTEPAKTEAKPADKPAEPK